MPSIDLSDRSNVLAIIGQGYVGLPLAMAAVDAGWTVIGIEKSESRVLQLNSGSSPVEDISDTRLQKAISSQKYQASINPSDVSDASVVTICVPTPLDEARNPDLNLLVSATRELAPYLSDNTLLVSESTSYPGTLRDVIIPIVEELKSDSAKDLFFASAPERVNPGDPVWDQKNTPRLVGGIDSESQKRALNFYKSICDAVVATSTPEIAEAAKILENTFRLVNIAMINEFTQICSSQGINVHEVIDAAATKPYGFMPFRPGVGIGGHCIPVDPMYLTWWARKDGLQASLVERSDEISRQMPGYVADRALAIVANKTKNPRVLILGVAYKPGVSDVRETPSKQLKESLLQKGAEVAWVDPLVLNWEGTEPVSENWNCDVAIIAIKQTGINIQSLLDKGVPILDCTNSFAGMDGVLKL